MTETNDNNDSSFPRSRVRKQSNHVLYLFIITILLLTGGFFFYQKNVNSLQSSPVSENSAITNQANSTEIASTKDSHLTGTATSNSGENGGIVSQDDKLALNQGETSTSSSSEFLLTDTGSLSQDQISTGVSETETVKNSASGSNISHTEYKELIAGLNSFYAHLDSQPYMQSFKLPDSSKEHFSKLIQKLIDNPPVVTRETDDLFTLLKNTAHFFRIIGKDDILVLKGILDREKDSFESILQTLYTLTNEPKLLKDEYYVSLDPDALYDYAGFFLNTMGGRLYLFRRDSNSRMAVSFYAIAIIDRANDSGNSRHGIDIRPAIDSLIEEIENGGKNLKMRDFYLDTLYDLKVKYD